MLTTVYPCRVVAMVPVERSPPSAGGATPAWRHEGRRSYLRVWVSRRDGPSRPEGEASGYLSVPAAIREKPPTAGLWAATTDESELGASYRVIDAVLGELPTTNADVQKRMDPGSRPLVSQLLQTFTVRRRSTHAVKETADRKTADALWRASAWRMFERFTAGAVD